MAESEAQPGPHGLGVFEAEPPCICEDMLPGPEGPRRALSMCPEVHLAAWPPLGLCGEGNCKVGP